MRCDAAEVEAPSAPGSTAPARPFVGDVTHVIEVERVGPSLLVGVRVDAETAFA